MEETSCIRVETKYGTANISHGYLRITSKKEGNYMKAVHRLVFEEYHNCKLEKTDEIHHIDGDKLNNHPSNLVCMSKKAHSKFHMTGRVLSEESRKKIGDNQKNKKVTIIRNGFKKNGKQIYALYDNCRVIKSSVNLNKLLDWFKENYPNEEIPKLKS